MTQSKDKATFAKFLVADQDRLYGYIHSLVRDVHDAQDLFQQTALILWKKFDEYDSERSFFAWACGVARLEALNFLRSRRRLHLSFSDELNLLLIEANESHSREEREERRQALSDCVKKLPVPDQELVEECYGSGRTIVEIAARRGRASQSIHNSLRRVRHVLFDCVRRTLAISEKGGFHEFV